MVTKELGYLIFNYIGGTLRWIYGTTWRTIFNKPKFTYKEYIFGPKDSDDHFDIHAHQFNNRIIAIIFMGTVIALGW